MSSTGNTNPGNFANRPHEEVSEIAKKGGQASHAGGFASMDPEKQVISTPSPANSSEVDDALQKEIASMGGKASSSKTDPVNTNPGNFANRPHEEVVEIAKKGGQASHTGGFASMDPEKQVIFIPKSSNVSEVDDDNDYRRKLHPWAGKPRADRLRRVVRQRRRPGRRVALLLE